MTDKPTGVFVHLPLSDEDCMTIRKHITSKCLTNDGIVNGLLAIGTPVTGGELEPLAFVNADRLKWKIATDNDVCLTFSGKPHLGGGTLNLIDGIVLQSDALAKLAEKDAEIALHREALRMLLADWEDCMGDRPSIGSNAARKALKSPEA